MSKPLFVVPVADLERGPRSVSWPIPPAWLENALRDTEATPRGEDGQLEVELTKSGADVLVRGHARVTVLMPCVVTLQPLTFELNPEILLLLSPSAQSVAAQRGGRGPRKKPEGASRGAKTRPKAAPETWTEDGELSAKDAARDVFDGDKVVLDEFLREFVVLELPMYPRASDLPSEQSPARATPLPSGPPAPEPVDPRLKPLAELRDRLRQSNNKE